MRSALRFAELVDGFHRHLATAVSWLLLAMVAIGAGNALARTFEGHLGFRLSSNAWLEAQWYLFGAVFLLAAPNALRLGAHVRVDVIYSGHPPRARAWIDFLGAVLLLVPFCLFGVWASQSFVWNSIRDLETSSDPGGLPRWPLKPVIPIAFALLALQGIAEVIRSLAVLRGVDAGGDGGRGDGGRGVRAGGTA